MCLYNLNNGKTVELFSIVHTVTLNDIYVSTRFIKCWYCLLLQR